MEQYDWTSMAWRTMLGVMVHFTLKPIFEFVFVDVIDAENFTKSMMTLLRHIDTKIMELGL